MGKYDQLCIDILNNVGGTDNINSVAHCITRLRFKLKDEKIANTEALKKMEGVVTVMQSGGQYQVVIGNHVPEVYKEFLSIAGLSDNGVNPNAGETAPMKGSILDRLIDIISSVVQPLLPVMAATGMIKGVLSLLEFMGWILPGSGTYAVLTAIGDCFLYFFPIYLGFTAAKKFGVSQYVGMAIGAALVYPTISAITPMTLAATGAEPIMTLFAGTIIESPIYSTFLGIPLIMPANGYASTLIPAIVAVAFAAPIERFFKKIMPTVVRTFLVPFFTLLIVIPLTFLVIGPITSWISDIIGTGIMALFDLSSVVMGVVLGALWQVLVIFGLHWALIPIYLTNLGTLEFDMILPTTFGASFAQIGVVLAIMLKTKDKKLRSLTIPAFISGIFGVTEPAIYGVTLPRKKTFVMSCIAAGVGGGIVGFFQVKVFTNGGLSFFQLPSYVNPDTGENFIPQMLIVIAVSFVLGVVLGWFSFKDEAFETEAVTEATPSIDTSLMKGNAALVGEKPEIFAELLSPVEGEVVELSTIADPVFASGAMGRGVAINPSADKIYAPANGMITAFMDTKHAIGMKTDQGIELLIHVGMDTVQLGGKHFTSYVEQNSTVEKGQLLLEFDRKAIEADGFSVVTPIVITNSDQYFDVLETENSTVRTDEVLLRILK